MPLKFCLKKINIFSALFVLALSFFVVSGFFDKDVKASVIDDLKKQIQEYSKKSKELEEKTKIYENSLYKTKKEKNTLSGQIRSLENDIYNLNLNIKKTQTDVVETSLTIDLLDQEIKEKNKQIKESKKQMAYILQLLYEKSETSLFSIILSSRDFSQALNQKEQLSSLEKEVSSGLKRIKNLKTLLEKNKIEQERKRSDLYKLSGRLSDQQKITNNKKLEKNKLLRETKNQEYRYRKILSDLSRQRQNIEKEIGGLERKLKEAINRAKLPQGKGILKYPLDHVRVTQGYGMTRYAKSGAYNGNGHNGVDLGGATGTPVKSAANGVVLGVGNNGRYAYGKWIAIKHDNGLVTLYGHMSLQKVKKGQRVKTGQLIGYVGATGYVTGPHLHFTVYAPDSFDLYQSSRVSWLWIPIGAPLNPFDYL